MNAEISLTRCAERGVDDADGLLVVSVGPSGSPGTDLAVARATQQSKPMARIDVRGHGARALLAALLGTLGSGRTLNVAGPKESEQPGIYDAVYAFFDSVVDLFAEGPSR